MAARARRGASAPAETASQATTSTSAATSTAPATSTATTATTASTTTATSTATAPDAPVLRVDLSRPVPPYEQLRAQISGLVAGGQLPPGSRLPSVRQLAGDLGLAPGTVARAYSELESAGVLATRHRGGTFIAGVPAMASPDAVQQRVLAAAADSFVAFAKSLGLSDETAEAAVRQAIARAGAA